MDRTAYLNNLQKKKNSAAFDHFLTTVNLIGDCPVRFTNNVIGGKWKPVLYNLILHDVNRFGEIIHLVEGLSKKVLATQLKEMESDGLIKRTVYHQLPQKVEYSLTERGKTFEPIIESMCQWALKTQERKRNSLLCTSAEMDQNQTL